MTASAPRSPRSHARAWTRSAAGTASPSTGDSCPLGGQHYLATGEVLPDAVLDELRKSDAILLGAVGTPGGAARRAGARAAAAAAVRA